VTDDIVFAGHVSDAELAALYRESDLLAHFSSYEGFGLPIVEAMRAGLPVVCTDGGSQPEVAGDAAEIVKAGDELALSGAIADILSSPEKMLGMRARGPARAANFSWEKCARETLAALLSSPAR
jgi:glycosyltransferase involved in cell wall biosynthesis